MITLGLSEIQVGTASSEGTMPKDLSKIGKTYRNTAKINQEKADVTEHFEEGKASPEFRKKSKKTPVLSFSIMDPDIDQLVKYVGGTKIEASEDTGQKAQWGFDGDEIVENKAIRVISEQGLNFDIPNADIEANINADMSAKGIFLVDFVVTPCAVSKGKAFRAYPKE